MDQSLKGKVAFVTGAARNIGRAIALSLAERGADVAIGARKSSPEIWAVEADIVAKGRKCCVAIGDVSDEGEVCDLVGKVSDVLGPVTILVNNAAIRPQCAFSDLTLRDWNKVMATNLTGPFLLSKFVLPEMIKAKYGRIINISGIDAFKPLPNRTHNICSKAALSGLSRALAYEYGKFGVCANTLVLGVFDTSRDERNYPWFSNLRQKIESENPVPRLGRVGEVGQVCAFLATSAADYICGEDIYLDGGMRMI